MNVPLKIEEIKKHEGRITNVCRKYLIGKLCLQEKAFLKDGKGTSELQTQIGREFGYTGGGIKNVTTFTKAVEKLYKAAPIFVTDVIAGRTKVSYRNVIKLSKEQNEPPKKRGRPKLNPSILSQATIKNTPPYDPDSQVIVLALTIPSWVSMVESVFMNTVLHKVSKAARKRLINELMKLTDTAETMIALLHEK
jgi:hypothetical protein